jgi:predicted Zn-ribbon and HTH transcriptional regulator
MSPNEAKRKKEATTDAYWCEVCGIKFVSEIDPKECPACKAARIDIVQIYTEGDATVDEMRATEEFTAGD